MKASQPEAGPRPPQAVCFLSAETREHQTSLRSLPSVVILTVVRIRIRFRLLLRLVILLFLWVLVGLIL